MSERAARRAYPPEGSFVEAAGVRLHYVERGSGPAVVLLHGNPGSHHHFLAVIDALAATHRAIAFDRPGHGWSDPAPHDGGSPLVQEGVITAALRALGVERAILVAESWSASLALEAALDFPEQTTAVVSAQGTFYEEPTLVAPIYPLLVSPILGPVLRWTVAPFLARRQVRRQLERSFAPLPVPAGVTRRSELLWSRPSALHAVAGDALRRAEVVPELAPRYPEITVPVVLLVGTEDEHVPQEAQAYRLKRELPAATLIELPGVGHLIAESRPQAIVDAVRSVGR